jgi:hypothetical protein
MAILIAQDVRDELEGYCLDKDMLSDAWIERCRDRTVVPYVERIIDFPIASPGQGRTTEYRSGTGSSIVILSRRPVLQVHSVTLVTNPSNWIYVSPTAMEVIVDEGIIKLRTVLEAWTSYVPAFPRGKDNIKIDYSYGYAVVPDDIKDCVIKLVASYALGFIGSRTGGGNVNVPGIGRSYGTRGKFGDIRLEMERYAASVLRKYATGTKGS